MKTLAGNPYLVEKEGNVFIESVSIHEILEEFKPPLFIFLENKIRDNVKIFKEVFTSHFENSEFFYSFKANFLPEICTIIHSEHVGAEIIGELELSLALKLGFSPSDILLGGPYLPDSLISRAISLGVKEIIVHDLKDLKKINAIAQQQGRVQDTCIRVHSTKYGSKLGIELTQHACKELQEVKNKFQNIQLKTLLSHLTTQMNNINQYRQNLGALISSIRKLNKMDVKLKNLNFGGGFPEATVMKRNQLEKIASFMEHALHEMDLEVERVYFEPGRYFVGDAGILIAEIIKVMDDRTIFINVGNHICPKFAKGSYRFYNLSRIKAPHKFKTSINGIVPTDQDILAKDYFFTKELKEGDKVLITNVGAYTLTFSNRFPYSLPLILSLNKTRIKKIFDPINNKDFSLQHWI
ncbi:MAG: diaminopimelate decarboxylase family protein [Promethearchaeota archaeon]